MRDQASTLRAMVEKRDDARRPSEGGEYLALVGGKGGVGKSVLAVAMAFNLSNQGNRVLLIDANMSAPSLHILMNEIPSLTVSDLVYSDKAHKNIELVSLTATLDLLPNLIDEANASIKPTQFTASAFIEQIDTIVENYDYILLDTESGPSPWTLGLLNRCNKILLVSTAEPTAVIASYTFLKSIYEMIPITDIRLVLNQALPLATAEEAHQKLNTALRHFLDFEISLSGVIPFDMDVKVAVSTQEPFWISSSGVDEAIEETLNNTLQTTEEMDKN